MIEITQKAEEQKARYTKAREAGDIREARNARRYLMRLLGGRNALNWIMDEFGEIHFESK